ncbi:MAG TPA: ATP synthase F1 subunit epsilon [Tepidisphaeraceae bacterium]|jgi:F-type H+-transporting ATPase subunit epsilon|nr:ATP synthase F1 subunit epsilon [Tepidisphaeraceae bacterium]
MSFHCVIVTPEKQAFEANVTQAVIPAYDGQLGILSGHAPVLAKLGVGSLRVDLVGGGSRHFLVDGGVAQMKDNELSIVTDDAVAASELNADTARAALAEAQARKDTDPLSIQKRQHEMRKAQAAIELAGKA